MLALHGCGLRLQALFSTQEVRVSLDSFAGAASGLLGAFLPAGFSHTRHHFRFRDMPLLHGLHSARVRILVVQKQQARFY
jgi:hypothetical protein